MPVPVPIPVLDLKAYNATTGMLQDKITRIISKPKQTWQEQVLIKLCCWMSIAQKQSMTPNFFYYMISPCVQNLHLPYWKYDCFLLEDMNDDECKAEFRFLKEEPNEP